MIGQDVQRVGKRRIWRVVGTLAAVAVVGAIAVAGFLLAARLTHAAARLTSEQCKFVILPGHSDTKSYTYADGDTVTVHSQLYEDMDTVTQQFCGEMESITTVSDNGRGAPLKGLGADELNYRQPDGTYKPETFGVPGTSNTIPPIPITETTNCAAPGGIFWPDWPKVGEPVIRTGAANYCPPQ